MQVASLRNEVARLKDELAERKEVEEAGKVKGTDEKTEEVRSLKQRGVVEVENLELGGLEVVKEFSIEVSSDEETTTSGSGEEKLIIDETTKCEETVGKASLCEHVKATPRKTPAKKTIEPKKKGKGVEKNVEHASKAGEDIAKTEVVSRKVQRQVAKEKSKGDKAKECSGPFQCSVDECQDSWVKVPGWERKVKMLN